MDVVASWAKLTYRQKEAAVEATQYGVEAYEQGVSFDANPYQNKLLRAYWEFGWQYAQVENEVQSE